MSRSGSMLHAGKIRHRFARLLRQRVFWQITITGNGILLAGALVFNWLEGGVNPAVHSFLDSLHWSVGMVTTVGYGTVIPITAGGKWLSMLMMLAGCLFIWSYMALFVGALLAPDLGTLEREIREVESGLGKVEREVELEVQLDKKTAERLIHALNELKARLDRPQSGK